MKYQMTKENLDQIKDIGFDKLINDFTLVIGSHLGGDDYAHDKAQTIITDFLNEMSVSLDADAHIHITNQ